MLCCEPPTQYGHDSDCAQQQHDPPVRSRYALEREQRRRAVLCSQALLVPNDADRFTAVCRHCPLDAQFRVIERMGENEIYCLAAIVMVTIHFVCKLSVG